MQTQIYRAEMPAISTDTRDPQQDAYKPNYSVFGDLERIAHLAPIKEDALISTSPYRVKAGYFQIVESDTLFGILLSIHHDIGAKKQSVLMQVQTEDGRLPLELQELIDKYHFRLKQHTTYFPKFSKHFS